MLGCSLSCSQSLLRVESLNGRELESDSDLCSASQLEASLAASLGLAPVIVNTFGPKRGGV